MRAGGQPLSLAAPHRVAADVIGEGDGSEHAPARLTPMRESRWRRGGDRLLPFAGAVAFHLLLLSVVVGSKPPPMLKEARAINVSLMPGLGQIALNAPPSISPPLAPVQPPPDPAALKPEVETKAAANPGSSLHLEPKPDLKPPINLIPLLVDVASGAPSLTATPISIDSHPVKASPTPAQTTGGTHCQLLENLKLGLQSSDAVKAALLLIPKTSLSVANAILLWNGRWIDDTAAGGPAALGPIEQAVVQTVSQTPPDCQSEILHGVRFVTLGDARDTMVLAFGSADWRWSDLIATLSPPINP